MITHALGYQYKLPPKAIRETDLYAELKLTEIFRRPSRTGIWYDPQDLTTLFQDASGTLPVYRPGTGLVDPPVGLMLDKSGGGYHASQSTTTARPTLSGRHNLLTATGTLSTQSVTTVAANYTLSFSGTGTITLSGRATGTYSAGTHAITCTAGTLTLTVAGSVTKADLRATNDTVGVPAYQRVDSATTYDTARFPLYLKFDGADDFLQTANVDLTGTSVVTVGTGARSNLNQAAGVIFEMGTNADSFDKHFNSFFTPTQQTVKVSAPPTSVMSLQTTLVRKIVGVMGADRSAGTVKLTANGVAATASNTFTTVPFGNLPLYIGARAGTAYFLNGQIYSLCIIGAPLSTSEQAVLERYLNSKMRAY